MKSVRSSASPFNRICEIGAIDIGDEMQFEMRRNERRERSGGHGRAEIRTADPDIDDVGEGGAGGAPDRAVAHVLREVEHLAPLGEDLGHHVDAARAHRRSADVAQRHVERRPRFGLIDDLAGKERFAPFLYLRRAGEIEEQRERRSIDPLFGKVEQDVVEFEVKVFESPRVRCEEIGERHLAHIGVMGFERKELLGEVEMIHARVIRRFRFI